MAFTKIAGAGINSTHSYIFHEANVTGLSTFVGVGTFKSDLYVAGNLFVGTGTASYGEDIVARNINASGIITTKDFNFTGNLYKNGAPFVSGIGIGSTDTNPQSSTITNRIGAGFTDINIVGTGLSITGYGSTVVVDLSSISQTYYNYFEISGLATSYGELSYKYIKTSDGETVDLSEISQYSPFISSKNISPSIDSNGNLIVVI